MVGLNRGIRKVGAVGVFFALVLCWGCSRPGTVPGGAAATSRDQKAPFPQDIGADVPIDSQPLKQDPNGANQLPFSSASRVLPAGTLVTVRLEDPISTTKTRVGGAFSAVVDEPVIIDGNTVVERGVGVSGRLQSAQKSPLIGSSASMRLTLDTITIEGKRCPLQTASLFAKEAPGTAGNSPIAGQRDPGATTAPAIVHLRKGRRLTFRLTEAAFLGG